MKRVIKFRERLKDGFHYWGFISDCFVGPVSPLNHSDQFTGLKDKNGKEIYECDVLKYYDGSKFVLSPEMHTMEDNGYVHGWWTPEEPTECGVLGNKFENPELIGGVS